MRGFLGSTSHKHTNPVTANRLRQTSIVVLSPLRDAGGSVRRFAEAIYGDLLVRSLTRGAHRKREPLSNGRRTWKHTGCVNWSADAGPAHPGGRRRAPIYVPVYVSGTSLCIKYTSLSISADGRVPMFVFSSLIDGESFDCLETLAEPQKASCNLTSQRSEEYIR